MVVYGQKEPAEGTPRYQSDLQSVRESLESVADNLSEYAIRDCLRLGRYNVSKHQPVLVKLSCTCDIASVLSTWYTKLGQTYLNIGESYSVYSVNREKETHQFWPNKFLDSQQR